MTKTFSEQFKDFLVNSPFSVWKTELVSHFNSEPYKTSIVKLSTENAEVIRFFSEHYTESYMSGDTFGRIQHEDIEGAYLVKEDFLVFDSTYWGREYLPLLSDTKAAYTKDLVDEINQYLIDWVKQKVKSLQPTAEELDIEEDEHFIKGINEWYRDGASPEDYLFYKIDYTPNISSHVIPYIRKHLNKEDFAPAFFEALGSDFNLRASRLNYIQKKHREFESDPVIQREKQIYSILKNELKDAVTVNIVKHDGETVKVENKISTWRNGEPEIGKYDKEVAISEIKHIIYKKKIYGDTPPPVKEVIEEKEPADFDKEGATASCSECGIVVDEVFINMVDYDMDLCLSCEENRKKALEQTKEEE